MSVKCISYTLKTTMFLIKFEKNIVFNYSLITDRILCLYENEQEIFNNQMNIDTKHYELLLELKNSIDLYLQFLCSYIDGELSFEDESSVRESIKQYREIFFSNLSKFLLSYAMMFCGSIELSINEDISTIFQTLENIITDDNINNKTLMKDLGYNISECNDSCSAGNFTFLSNENRLTLLNGIKIQKAFYKNATTIFLYAIGNLDSTSESIYYLHQVLIKKLFLNFESINYNFEKIVSEMNYLSDLINIQKIILTENYTINFLYIVYSITYNIYYFKVLLEEIYTYIDNN